MGKNDVEINVGASTAGAQQAWIQMIGLVRQMQTEMKRMNTTLETQGKRGNREIGSLSKGLKSAALELRSFLGIGTGIGALVSGFRMLSAEMRAQLDMYQMVQNKRVTLLEAREDLAAFSSPKQLEAIDQIISMYKGPITSDVGYKLTKGIISADIFKDVEQPEAARTAVSVMERFPQYRDNPEALKDFATGLQRVMQVFPDEVKSRQQGLDVLQQYMQTLRTEEIASFAKHGVQGAAQLGANFGLDINQAFGLMAAVGMESGDPMGRRTATGLNNFFRSAIKAAPSFGVSTQGNMFENMMADTENARKMRAGMVGRFAADPETARIAAMVRSRRAHELTGEAKIIGQLIQLLQEGDNRVKQAYQRATDIGDPVVASREQRAREKRFASDEKTLALRQERAKLAEQNERAMDPISQEEAKETARQRIMAARRRLEEIPETGVRARLAGAYEWISGKFSSEDPNVRAVRRAQEMLAIEIDQLGGGRKYAPSGKIKRGDFSEVEDFTQLERLLEELRLLNEEMRAINATMQRSSEVDVISMPPLPPELKPSGAGAMEGQ